MMLAKSIAAAILVSLTFLWIPLSPAQLLGKRVLSLDAAKKIMAAAEVDAKAKQARVVIAIVDDAGQLILLERLDRTGVAWDEDGSTVFITGGSAVYGLRTLTAGAGWDRQATHA